MSQGLKTFSLKFTTLNFGTLIDGFGEGDAITIEPTAETWVSVEGVDGSIARAYTGSESFKFKIRLLQTSPANAIFSAIYYADKSIAGGAVLPFLYKDQGGGDIFVADSAWFLKVPAMTRGNKINTTEWEGQTGKGRLFHGGN